MNEQEMVSERGKVFQTTLKLLWRFSAICAEGTEKSPVWFLWKCEAGSLTRWSWGGSRNQTPWNTLTHFGLTLSKTGSLEWCKQDPILKNRITYISLLHFCVCDLPGQCIGLLALKAVLEWSKKKKYSEKGIRSIELQTFKIRFLSQTMVLKDSLY